MAHPKHKISKTRRDKRRGHQKLDSKPMYIDPVNGEPTLLHRVNLASGYYKGRQVTEGTEE